MFSNPKVKLIIAVFLLFAVVAVDFVSKFMSIVFDAVFVSVLIGVLWPTIKDVWNSP